MQIVTSIAAMQQLARQWQHADRRIGLVPTMGYLHAGHISLVRVARRHAGKAGKVVVSIYVNPTQFGPKEDFSKYPRDLKRDLKLCREAGVDVVFTPSDKEMYPQVGSSRRDDRTARRAVPTKEMKNFITHLPIICAPIPSAVGPGHPSTRPPACGCRALACGHSAG